jgi:branched-chain amino acid transport system permease protein
MSKALLGSRRSAAFSLLAPLALVGLVVLLGVSGTPSLQGTVTLILCNLIIVLGLQVFIGNSGVYSFGQVGFAAIGAYLAALLTLPAAISLLQTPDLPGVIADADPGPLATTLIAAAACALLAAIVGLPLMRTSTLAIPISTFAFLIVVYNVIDNWEEVTGGSGGLISIPTTTTVTSAGAWAALAVVAALAFKWSASGYRLRATRENEVAARSLGIGVMRERLAAFALSGALCGIGGALAVHQSGVLSPTTFYFGATVTTLTMLVVGGSGSVFGAVLGAVAVSAVNELLRGLEDGASLFGLASIGETPGLAAIGLGIVLLLAMIAMPGGLSGGREAGELSRFRRRRDGIAGAPVAVRPGASNAREQLGGQELSLTAEGISVAFGGLRVLSGIDARLARGEILGLIGPNGAGKTTLVNVLSGFQVPDSGRLELNGVDVSGFSPARLARAGLARTFQAALPFPQLSALESAAVGAMAVGVGRRRAGEIGAEVLGRLGLTGQAHRAAVSLPPGRQRLLGIARALATGPRYLLLDEPAAGLNDDECEELVAVIRGVLEDFGCGILLIEHDMSLVMELCGRVQVLDEGVTVAIGTPQEVQADPVVIEAYLGASYLAVADA